MVLKQWLSTIFAVSLVASLLVAVGKAPGYSDDAPICYTKTPARDAIARLQEQLDRGQVKLAFSGERGYLDSVLEKLKVPASSQSLVFSKTSLQWDFINPRKPRAIYFNDDAYVGFVRHAPLMELSAIDPNLGAVFYTLKQEQTDKPQFVRKNYECLQCHESGSTESVPGVLMRSVFPDMAGQPIQSGGTFNTTPASPLSERWGGWYVTGTTGQAHHMGNTTYDDEDHPDDADVSVRSNLADLKKIFNTSPYPRPTSDVVALMVLGHQQQAHNLMTSTSYYARTSADVLNISTAGHPSPQAVEALQSRIGSACEILVKRLLFSGEVPLAEPIQGTSGFAEEFASQGPRDDKGRSLRDFDLKTRLFKYRCSYLVYSEQFQALPEAVKTCVDRRLWEVLSGKDQTKAYEHLSADDRTAILQILRNTMKNLPDYWQEPVR